jgi:hypothetical protein
MYNSLAFCGYFSVGMTGVLVTILMATMGDLSIELNHSLNEILPDFKTRT